MEAKSIIRVDTKEITVASKDHVSLTIFPCEEKIQTWLHIKRKDVEVWERVLSFLTIDIKHMYSFELNFINGDYLDCLNFLWGKKIA